LREKVTCRIDCCSDNYLPGVLLTNLIRPVRSSTGGGSQLSILVSKTPEGKLIGERYLPHGWDVRPGERTQVLLIDPDNPDEALDMARTITRPEVVDGFFD